MRAERLIAITRDVLFLVGGSSGIAYQQITGRVSELLLAVYVAMLGVPAGIGLVQLRPTSTSGESGTPSSPSPSPGPPSASASASGSPSVPPGGGDP